VASPASQKGVQRQRPAADEPPSWLDEVPPPADEYLPAVDQGDHADRFGDADLMDDGVSRLDWVGLEARVAQCVACELHKTRTQTVFGVGRRDADLMVIGEAPGADEDRKGEPFVGRAGQLLNAMLKAIGLGREQAYIANILKCRPPGNRDPRAEEALQCAPYLQRQVALVKPRVILAVGAVAARNLLQCDEAVGRLRGGQHQFNGIPVVVTYHPAYLLRSPEQKAKAWQDLQKAARLIL
jgi:DNA polymerase